jgi:4-oxalocrotonate tautomerase family enzyme
MPVVTVQLWTGRTLDQKRALVRAITDAMVEHAGARPDALHVVLQEVDPQNWGLGGVIGPDRTDAHAPPPTERTAPRILHVALRVSDSERSERFYCDLLGMPVRERSTFRDGKPLLTTTSGLGMIGDGESSTDHVAFEVQDLGRLERELRAEGVEVVRGPMETGYGTSLYVLDPDGVEIELIEPKEAGA